MSARHLIGAQQRRRRQRIEALIERLIDRLDTMDAPFADLEPEEDDDATDEASQQPPSLSPCTKPVRRLRRIHA